MILLGHFPKKKSRSIWATNNWVQHSYLRYVVNLQEEVSISESYAEIPNNNNPKYVLIGLDERIIIKDRCPLA
jgi:hypothetical protein